MRIPALLAPIFAAVVCVVAPHASAQTPTPAPGTFAGMVASDTLEHGIAKAEVEIPALKLKVTTNARGVFELKKLPPGRYLVTVRALGYEAFADSIDIQPGSLLDGDIVMTPTGVTLEAQRTTAASTPKQLPIGLQEMAQRMKEHIGGAYVTDSMLRANDERKLMYFMAKIPGVDQVLAEGGSGTFLAARHSTLDSRAVSDGSFPANKCYIDIYMNGAKFFIGPANPGNPPPDFNAFWAREYSGIEFYPNGAAVPAQYNSMGGGCGVLLLWTRRPS